MTPKNDLQSTEPGSISRETGGGAVALRGFVVQTLVALLDVLTAEPPIMEITLEPKVGNDQFDFVWSDGTRRYAKQVKTTQNSFTVREAREWAEKMEKESGSEECSLILVGIIPSSLDGVQVFGKVKIERYNLDIPNLLDVAAARLEVFMEKAGLPRVSFQRRSEHVRALVTRLQEFSVVSQRYTRKALCSQLCDWLAIKKPSGENAYPRVVDAVNDMLSCKVLGPFMFSCSTVWFTSTEKGVRLCDSVGCARLDIKPLLDAILARISDVQGKRELAERLDGLVGSLLVLAVDPSWTRSQRQVYREGALAYPGERFDKTEGSQSVNCLNLVLCAIADRPCRLEELFRLSVDEDDRRIPGPSELMRGILVEDKSLEIKLGITEFMRGIIYRVQKRKPETRQDIEKLFDEVREQIAEAFTSDRPYHATDPAFQPHVTMLKRDMLLSSLLLIYPGSGSETDIIDKAHLLVTRLHRLKSELKTLT